LQGTHHVLGGTTPNVGERDHRVALTGAHGGRGRRGRSGCRRGRRGRGSGRRRRCCGRGGAVVERGEHVVARDAAAGAGPRDGGRVEVVLGEQLAHDG